MISCMFPCDTWYLFEFKKGSKITNPGAPDRVKVPTPLVTPAVLLLNVIWTSSDMQIVLLDTSK